MRTSLTLVAAALLSSLSMTTPTLAAEALPDLAWATQGSRVEVTPPAGHHFNDKAPAALKEGTQKIAHTLKRERLEATISGAGAHEFALEVYVCDDANTFCKKKTQTLRVPAGVGSAGKAGKTAQKGAGGASAHVDKETGFLVNDPDKAYKLAAERKLPLMIDFFGIWCPPCNHLDAMVFKTAEFKKKNKQRFVLLKLDADDERFESYKTRYKIQALPTVIFATPAGDEIFRLVGYHPLEVVLAKAEAAHHSKDEGYAQLETLAHEGNAEARFKAAKIALDRDEPAKALELLKPLKELLEAAKDGRVVEYYRAEIGTALAAGDKKLARKTLEKSLKEFGERPEAIEDYDQLADLQEGDGDADAAKKSTQAAAALASKLLGNPDKLKGSYYTQADMAQTRAELLVRLGEKAQAKEAYVVCAAEYEKEARAERSAYARGPNLERSYCLGKAGEVQKAEALYKEGIKRFPMEYTFHQGLAKLWLDAGKPKDALTEGEKALALGYGNQRLKAAMTVVRAHEGLSQLAQAVAVIDAELKSPDSGEQPLASTVKLRERLRAKADELKKKLGAQS